MRNVVILILIFFLPGIALAENCNDALLESFMNYEYELLEKGDISNRSKYFDIDGFIESAKEHYRKENITGLLFVNDEELNKKANQFIDDFNNIFSQVVGIYSYTTFCNNNKAELFLQLIEKNKEINIYGINYIKKSNSWKIDAFKLINYSVIAKKYSGDFTNEFKKIEKLFINKKSS